MSVIVELNSVELLVDLMKFPGQLIPFSNKTLIMYHISATGESDSAENDSCDSPLEPNSPLYGLCEKIDSEGWELSFWWRFCSFISAYASCCFDSKYSVFTFISYAFLADRTIILKLFLYEQVDLAHFVLPFTGHLSLSLRLHVGTFSTLIKLKFRKSLLNEKCIFENCKMGV